MNVIIISSSIKASGGVRQALYQARSLMSAGHRVHFVNHPQSELREIDPLMPWVDLPQGLKKLNQTLRSLMPAGENVVVHAFHNRAVKAVAYLGTLWRLQRLPVVCVAHRGVTNRPGNPLPYLLPGIRAYVVNSMETGQMLPLLWRKKRWHFVGNAIPEERLKTTRPEEEVRAELQIPPGNLVIGDVAHDKPAKGVSRLLESYAKSRAALPSSTLVMVGVTPEKFAPLARELGIEQEVRLLPRTEHVADYVQTFSLFVFPSYFVESQPNVIMEAMALNKPVIGSDIGNVKELIGERFTFKPGDVAEISAKLLEVGNSPDLMREAAAANYAKKDLFSADFRLRTILKIYEDALREDGLIQ